MDTELATMLETMYLAFSRVFDAFINFLVKAFGE